MKTNSLARQPMPKMKLIRTPIAAACALFFAAHGVSFAQSNQGFAPLSPSLLPSASATAPSAMNAATNQATRVNATVARVVVEVERDNIPADGVSSNNITVRLFDAQNQPVLIDALITIEHNSGRVLLPTAQTDEFGPGRLDADRATPGIQLKVSQGVGQFRLLAPQTAGDV